MTENSDPKGLRYKRNTNNNVNGDVTNSSSKAQNGHVERTSPGKPPPRRSSQDKITQAKVQQAKSSQSKSQSSSKSASGAAQNDKASSSQGTGGSGKTSQGTGSSGKTPQRSATSRQASRQASLSTKDSILAEFKLNRKLIPIKLAMFSFHGGAFAFLPYITLHMKQVGLTNEEIALIYAILPVSSILGPLVLGMIADKLGAFRTVFLINVILMGFLHTMLLLVPYAPRPPGATLRCDGSGGLMDWRPATCKGMEARYNLSNVQGSGLPYGFEWHNVNITIKNCQFLCDSPPSTATWCLMRGGSVLDCEEQDPSIALSLLANVSVPLTANITTQADNTTCTDVAAPRLSNFTRGNDMYESLSCHSYCPLFCDVVGLPDPRKQVSEEYSTTFWVYLALRVPAQFFTAAAFTMMDAVTMAVIAHCGGDFGKQRLMSMLSLAVVPLLASLVVHNLAKTEDGSADYAAVFYFGDVLLLVAIFFTICIPLERPESSSRNVFYDLRHLLSKVNILVFLLVVLMLGSNWGFLESFFFVYLTQLGAPTYLLGLTLTFGCLIGIPFMFMADRIISKVGRANIFIVSFLAYSVRMFGYSFISNPWLSFPFEALEIITYQLMWVAAVTYFPLLAPPTLLATMSGLAGTVHYNVGRGVGALLGGHLMDEVGSVNTFRVFGGLSLISGIAYCFLHYFYLKPIFKETDNKEVELKEYYVKTASVSGHHPRSMSIA